MQDRNLMILRKSFPVTFTAPPKGSFAGYSVAGSRSRAGGNGPAKTRVLDAGGGEGQTAIKMAERGIRSFYAIFLRR